MTIPHINQRKAISKLLSQVQEAGLWGQITIQVVSGNVVEARIIQTLKPEKFLDGVEQCLVVSEKSESQGRS